MSQFSLYFGLGMEHILDVQGYDHILFVIVLCAVYLIKDWRRVLILVTAFTVGHSITLALATLQIIQVNSAMVEFLIPVTIFLTALSNIFGKGDRWRASKVHTNYLLALFFGLIHGLGFSNYLRALLGKEGNITIPLLAFNIGIEVGQIIIVAIFLTLSFLFVDLFAVARRDWRMVISSAVGGIALILMSETKFW